MKAMEKIKLSKERVNLIADLKSGNLKGLAKIKASKRVVEIVVLLGGDGASTPAETTDMLGFDDRDYAFLTGVINGDYSNAAGNTLKALIQRGDSITLELSKRKGGVSPNANQLVQDAMLVLLGMSSEPTSNPLYQSVLNGAGTPAALAEPKHGDKVQVTGVVESSKDSPNLKFIRDDSGKSVTIFSQFGKSLKNGMTIKAELKWTGLSTGWAYSKLLEIISDPLASSRTEVVRKKKELSVADAGNLLYEMDGNRTDTVTLQEGWGKSTTYTRDEVLAVLATVQPTSNPLYQSVLDGAEVTIELVKQVRAEGQKDPDHPQLRPAVRVIVEAVKAMAA